MVPLEKLFHKINTLSAMPVCMSHIDKGTCGQTAYPGLTWSEVAAQKTHRRPAGLDGALAMQSFLSRKLIKQFQVVKGSSVPHCSRRSSQQHAVVRVPDPHGIIFKLATCFHLIFREPGFVSKNCVPAIHYYNKHEYGLRL